jgi:hypothetical protein
MPGEDFERRLYRKRAKIKVRFVELTDTITVQGPETEIEDTWCSATSSPCWTNESAR